jgi:hypothetical protein
VPADYRGLAVTLSGFLPFAATFAVVVWIWFEHYLFYFVLGPLHGVNGYLIGKSRERHAVEGLLP